MIKQITLPTCLLTILVLGACKTESNQNKGSENATSNTVALSEDELEAREDSIKLAKAYKLQEAIPLSVQPIVETQIVDAKATDDAADDPAIWINPKDATKSLIFGSNKKGGIATYDLSGKEIAYQAVGKVNNIEVLNDVPFKGGKISILGGTNRSSQSIDLFSFGEDGKLSLILSYQVDSAKMDDIYGYCFAKDAKTNKLYAIANAKNGLMQQFEIKSVKGGLALELAREVKFEDQVEGMVADEEYGNLFVGEENRGVWKLAIAPSAKDKTLIEKSTRAKNPNIQYDVEGITLLKDGKEGYLVVSSQGNFSYALFARTGNHDYINSFKVVDGKVDGTQETDGLVINTTPIGKDYPKGMMIIQDGFNYDGETLKPQNFKYVSVEQLLKQLGK